VHKPALAMHIGAMYLYPHILFCLPLAILPPLYDYPSVDFAELDLLDGTMGRFCAKCRHLPHPTIQLEI
jgi:hypothetical protein